jgi:hypothetical protein
MKNRIPFFSVLGKKQTYLNIVYILIAFPLSIAYFSLVITGLSLSIGFLVVFVGLIIFAGTLVMIRGFRWMDVQISKVFLGISIPIQQPERTEKGFFPFFKQLAGSPSTWKGFVYYLIVKFPIDTIIWSISISFLAITFDLLLAPALSQFWWFGEDDINYWLMNFFGDVYVLPFLGLIWGIITLHVIRGLAWVSATINQVFLSD